MIFSFVVSRHLAVNAANVPSIFRTDEIMQTLYIPFQLTNLFGHCLSPNQILYYSNNPSFI